MANIETPHIGICPTSSCRQMDCNFQYPFCITWLEMFWKWLLGFSDVEYVIYGNCCIHLRFVFGTYKCRSVLSGCTIHILSQSKRKQTKKDWKHKTFLIFFDIKKIINQWHHDWEGMPGTKKAVHWIRAY